MEVIVYFPNGTKATHTVGVSGVTSISTTDNKLLVKNTDPSLDIAYYNLPHSLANATITREIDPTS